MCIICGIHNERMMNVMRVDKRFCRKNREIHNLWIHLWDSSMVLNLRCGRSSKIFSWSGNILKWTWFYYIFFKEILLSFLRGYSSLEAWISGAFWSSVQTKQKIFLLSIFYHLFIDILRLHKKSTEKENSKFTKLWAGKMRGPKKRVSWRSWLQPFWSSEAKKPYGFLISIDAAIAWTSEKSKKYFSQNGGRLKKKFPVGHVSGNSELFKNSKIKNFHLSVVQATEECIKNINTKFKINRFIRTWNIVHANSKKVVSRKTRLKFWDKFPAILLIEWYSIFTYF